jgi:uncharacterized membrane protein
MISTLGPWADILPGDGVVPAMPPDLDPLPPRPSGQLPAPSLTDPCYVNAMIHFYRGELGRIMVWRQRLDVTTNWAITSTTTIVTIAFSLRTIPHIVFFFNLAVVWIMLWIEARRFRFYDAFRGRVRMLEVHFLVPMVTQNPRLLDGEWRRLVSQDLVMPAYKMSKLEAVGRRLKRNYVYIFAIIIVAWTLKILIHAPTPINSLSSFYAAFAVQGLPAWLGCLIYAGTVVSVIALLLYIIGSSRDEVGELAGDEIHRWRI